MLEVVRSFSLRDRVVAFVSAGQATELSCRLNVGVELVDDRGQQFVLTGVSSPRGGDQREIALVLRPVGGHKERPTGHLHSVG